VHDVVLGVAEAVLNLLVGDGDAEAADCGLIHPHHGMGWQVRWQSLRVHGQEAVQGGLLLLPPHGGGDVGAGRGGHPFSPRVLAVVSPN